MLDDYISEEQEDLPTHNFEVFWTIRALEIAPGVYLAPLARPEVPSNATRLDQMSMLGLVLSNICLSTFGFLSIVFNFFIFYLVLGSPKFRRKSETVTLAIAGIGGFLCGITYAIYGIRFLLIVTEVVTELTNALNCMLQLAESTAIIGHQLTPLVMLAISIDRVISASNFHHYREYGYIWLAASLSLSACVVTLVYCVAWVIVGDIPLYDVTFHPACTVGLVFPDNFILFYSLLPICVSTVAILIFPIVVAIMQFCRNCCDATADEEDLDSVDACLFAEQVKEKERTKKFGTMVFASLIFYTLPNIALLFILGDDAKRMSLPDSDIGTVRVTYASPTFKYRPEIVLLLLVKALHSIIFVAVYFVYPSPLRHSALTCCRTIKQTTRRLRERVIVLNADNAPHGKQSTVSANNEFTSMQSKPSTTSTGTESTTARQLDIIQETELSEGSLARKERTDLKYDYMNGGFKRGSVTNSYLFGNDEYYIAPRMLRFDEGAL